MDKKCFTIFFMNMVQEGKEVEAEKALSESFGKQDNGTFDGQG